MVHSSDAEARVDAKPDLWQFAVVHVSKRRPFVICLGYHTLAEDYHEAVAAT